jgi:hypothetical protein
MSSHTPHSLNRRDRLLKQPHPDSYRMKRKVSYPTLCKMCGAVFTACRWQ